MNKVVLMGRLTRDPDVRYTQGDNSMCIARYTLAVDRRFSRNNNDGQTADFISCVAFGRSGEFAEKYLHKGTKRPRSSLTTRSSLRAGTLLRQTAAMAVITTMAAVIIITAAVIPAAIAMDLLRTLPSLPAVPWTGS